MAYPVLAPGNDWYRSTTYSKSNITQIYFSNNTTPSSYTEVWNGDVNNQGEIKCYRKENTLYVVGNGSGKITCSANCNHMFVFYDDEDFDYFAASLTTISGLDVLDTSNVTTMKSMFYQDYDFSRPLQTISGLENWDTSKVIDMSDMFAYCTRLTSLDLSNWNTSNVTNMSNMFLNCENLTELNISNWDVSNVTNMERMFCSCYKLTEIDVSKWNTLSVENVYQTFMNCYSLTKLDFTNWDMTNVTELEYMLYECRALSEIIMGEKFKFTYSEDYDGDGIGDSVQDVWLLQPDPKYIPGATGVWFKSTGEQYNHYPYDPGTYYAVPPGVLINYRTIFALANIIRDSKLTDEKLSIDDISQGLAELAPSNLSYQLKDGTYLDTATIESIEIEEGKVTKIEIGNDIIYRAPITNMLPLATDSDRTTVLNGVGYVDGYRISESGGGPSSSSKFSASGFISCKPGDVIRIKGISPVAGSSSVLMTFNSSNTKVSSFPFAMTRAYDDWSSNINFTSYAQDSYENDVLTIILDSAKWGTGFDSFRFAAALFDGDEIVTINEEIY